MQAIPRPHISLAAWLALPLLFCLGCTPQATRVTPTGPASTPAGFEDQPEPAPAASATPLPAPSETPTNIPQAPVTLVLVGNAFGREALSLLGGYRDGAWLDPETAVDFIDLDAEYRAVALDGLEAPVFIDSISSGNGPVEFCNFPEFRLHTRELSPPLAVATNPGWLARPRPVEWLSSQHAFYLQALEAYLLSAGVAAPDAQLEQVLRADLDGDGADEVIIAASRFLQPDSHTIAPGDYSLVLARVLEGGEVVTRQLVGEVYFTAEEIAFPPAYSIQGVLDVNADGRMEVLVYRQVWEGYGVLLFEMQDGRLQEVLRLECGM